MRECTQADASGGHLVSLKKTQMKKQITVKKKETLAMNVPQK